MKHRKVTGVVISGVIDLDNKRGEAMLNQESIPFRLSIAKPNGDPTENRTPIAGLKILCPNR